MREDLEGASDRLMLWYGGLAVGAKQIIDPNRSMAHLIERRRELASRLANVDRELATAIAEQLESVPPDLQPPVEYALRALNAALEQLIARGEIHGTKTDRLAELIGKACQYAIKVVGYSSTFADGVFDSALKQLARARVAATRSSPVAMTKAALATRRRR